MTSLTEKMDKWLARNPLRKWRTATSTTLVMASAQAGVSRQTWWGWENGTYSPGDWNLPFLAQILKDKKIGEKIAAWKKKCPVQRGKG